MFGEVGRFKDAVIAYEQILERFGESTAPELREAVADALNNRGVMLGRLDCAEDALVSYEQVVERFGESAAPELRERVATALVNKGLRLADLGRVEDAVVTYDQVVTRFGDDTGRALHKQVAKALVNKGLTLADLRQLDRAKEATVAWEQVVDRFGEANTLALRKLVAKALFTRVSCSTTWRAPMQRYSRTNRLSLVSAADTDGRFANNVAKALFKQGVILGDHGGFEEAAIAYEQVVEHLGEAIEPPVRKLVAKALFNKGVMLLLPRLRRCSATRVRPDSHSFRR